MAPRPLSFFKFKLRDVRWTIVFMVIIMASILSWLVSFSMSSDVEATVSNYSKTITFIRVEPHSEIGVSYPVIPNDIVVAAESLQHVRRVYKVYMFKLAFVQRSDNISIEGLPLQNVTIFAYNPAVALGLGELPPFIVDVKNGRLPMNESEIATVTGGYKVGDKVEVVLNKTVVKVRISGLLTRSLLSPALVIVHRDFLLSVPEGKDLLNDALKGSSTMLFVEVDDIYYVEKVADELHKLLENTEMEFMVTYDEYLLKKTLELNERGALTVRLLNFGTLAFSAFLIAIVSYISVNSRRWEIGLLRSFGFSNNDVKAAYLSYSLAIATFGTIAAFLAAYIVGGPLKNLMLNAFGLSDISLVTAPQLTLTTTLFTFVLAASISAASILISISLSLRRPIEDDLREF